MLSVFLPWMKTLWLQFTKVKGVSVLEARPDLEWESLSGPGFNLLSLSSRCPLSALICDARAGPCKHGFFAHLLNINFITGRF